jgi:hypothetical protein
MGEELGWDEPRIEEEAQRYRSFVNANARGYVAT